MRSVTVNIGAANYRANPLFVEGQLIRCRGTKRIYLLVNKVVESATDTTITCRKGYKASPRSRLKYGKSPFSKIGIRIINPFSKKNNP